MTEADTADQLAELGPGLSCAVAAPGLVSLPLLVLIANDGLRAEPTRACGGFARPERT